jgi:hypothetical protein
MTQTLSKFRSIQKIVTRKSEATQSWLLAAHCYELVKIKQENCECISCIGILSGKAESGNSLLQGDFH